MSISYALRLAFTLHGTIMLSVPLAAWHTTLPTTSREPAENCVPLQQSKRLPGVNAVLDSAALAQRLQLLVGSDAGESVFSVNISGVSGRLLEGARSSVRDSMLAIVLAVLRPNEPSAPPRIRVRVRVGPAPQITLERSVLCAPEPVSGQHTDETLKPVVLAGSASGGSAQAEPLVATLHVNQTGEVIKVEVSGARMRDGGASFRRSLMANRYRPALLDGEPVAVLWQPGKRLELAK